VLIVLAAAAPFFLSGPEDDGGSVLCGLLRHVGLCAPPE
jgi:hypothetical protein